MTTAVPAGALRSFVGVPFDPQTYRTLVYNAVAFPLGVLYFVVLVTGLALTVGLGFTLAGPVVLLVTLLTIVTLAWCDGRLTGGLLDADVAPAFPETDDGLEFLKELLVGRLTWAGAVYLLWRFVLGLVVFVLLVVGFSVAGSLLVAPLGYGEYLSIHAGVWTVAIDTPTRALAASFVGLLVGLMTLHLSNLLGGVNATVASTLLDPAE